jgi:hypothetical protein
MLRQLIFINICFLSISCLAQKQDRIWIFGDHGGLDFNDTSNVVSFYSGLEGTQVKYSCGSIADQNGNLLFYAAPSALMTRSTLVFNRKDSLMVNGENIEGHPAQSQGLLILPFPADSYKYYIFTKEQHSSKVIMYYSVVDMTEDSSFGAVMSKNNMFYTDSLTQRTTAVKHANGRDWWLIVQRWDQDEYLKYLVTPSGFQGPFKQSTSNPIPKEEFYGTSYFSRSGSKLVSVGLYGNINLMNFDRCTGDISNYMRIGESVFSPENGFLGCAFSENENVLYVANTYPSPGKYIYQYDLTASDIKASKQLINMYPDTGLLQYVQYGHMLLGSDHRIYISKGNGSGPNSNTVYTQNMDVILNPDVVGPGCNYRSNYLYLNGGRTTYGLPNMINYNLGPVVGSICDSLSTGISENTKKNNPFTISPNPVSDWINIFQKEDFTNGRSYHAAIFTCQGQLVYEKEMSNGDYSIPVSSLTVGVYFLQLKTNSGTFTERVVKLD